MRIASRLSQLKSRLIGSVADSVTSLPVVRKRVDTEVENLEGIGGAQILGAIQRTDLAGDISLEHAAAEYQA